MWAHKIIEDMCLINKKFGNDTKQQIDRSVQFHLGEIISFDKIHDSAKKIYDQDKNYFTYMPYDSCYVEYVDPPFKCALIAFKREGYEYSNCIDSNGVGESKINKMNEIYKKDHICMVVFKYKEGEDSWAPYPYTYLVTGFSLTACAFMNNYFDESKFMQWKAVAASGAKTDIMSFYYFLLTINCKNVYKEEIKPSINLNKSRLKRNRLPLYSYHVLKVKPFGSFRAETIGKHDSFEHSRLHFCRGHFKQFYPTKPLFGKYVGLYWWQPCLRGKNKTGFVDKDYELVTEKSNDSRNH